MVSFLVDLLRFPPSGMLVKGASQAPGGFVKEKTLNPLARCICSIAVAKALSLRAIKKIMASGLEVTRESEE